MCTRMNSEHVLVNELLLTKPALVVLLLTVDAPRMVSQGAEALEGFSAYFANMQSILMPRHMCVQRRSCATAILANLADVRARIAVDLDMGL